MGKFIDIANQKFGMLTAIEVAGKNKQGFQWKCICDCGSEIVVNGANLRSGITTSCGCKRINTLHNRAKDITGKRFGRLVAIKRVGSNSYNKAVWECLCDCGNSVVVVGESLWNGLTKSCGCLHSELISNKQTINLVGLRFGRLVVLERVSPIGAKRVKYKCVCDCGKETFVTSQALLKKDNPTLSCGCYHRDRVIELNLKDISGERFGKLIAIERAGFGKHGSIWKCKCDCGNECYVSMQCLSRGNTESCGCIQSRAENIIENILKRNNIEYQRQKRFIGCEDVRSLPFDFYLPTRNIAIEYDGLFHYEVIEELGNDLEGQQRRDAIKTKYCEENDIILLRIPYWEKDNIESILSDWLFLNTETAGDEVERQDNYCDAG